MADIFSNLVTQSLETATTVKPLISPLFAPAPTLASETVPFALNDLSTVTPQVSPSPGTMEALATPEMPEVLDIATMPPDLVPPGVPHTTPRVSLLHELIQPPPLEHNEVAESQDKGQGRHVYSRSQPRHQSAFLARPFR